MKFTKKQWEQLKNLDEEHKAKFKSFLKSAVDHMWIEDMIDAMTALKGEQVEKFLTTVEKHLDDVPIMVDGIVDKELDEKFREIIRFFVVRENALNYLFFMEVARAYGGKKGYIKFDDGEIITIPKEGDSI
ncbi:MAG: hypothetical protein ACYCX4_12555 [Bacillota bacterium]